MLSWNGSPAQINVEESVFYWENSVLSRASGRDLILIPLPRMEGRSGADVETAISALACRKLLLRGTGSPSSR